MLIHGPRIGELARGVMPSGDGTRDDDYPARVVRAVAGYVRGQLLFSLAMGFGAGVGLYIYGVTGIFPEGKTYALAFGVFFGLMELIPYVGPFLGAAPPMLVALFSDPITALWVGLLFVASSNTPVRVVRVAGSRSTTVAGSAWASRSTPGQVRGADGTPGAAARIERVLKADPGLGIVRRADAG